MKIKKTELVKFIGGAIKRLEQQHQLNHQVAIEAEKTRVEEWEQNQGSLWDEAIAAMQAARKRKKPVTYGMLPGMKDGSYLYASNPLFGQPLTLPKLKPFKIPEDLAGMRSLLNAITDEEIDVKQLSMGDIRSLYRTYGE